MSISYFLIGSLIVIVILLIIKAVNEPSGKDAFKVINHEALNIQYFSEFYYILDSNSLSELALFNYTAFPKAVVTDLNSGTVSGNFSMKDVSYMAMYNDSNATVKIDNLSTFTQGSKEKTMKGKINDYYYMNRDDTSMSNNNSYDGGPLSILTKKEVRMVEGSDVTMVRISLIVLSEDNVEFLFYIKYDNNTFKGVKISNVKNGIVIIDLKNV